jgi:hypothetical protein
MPIVPTHILKENDSIIRYKNPRKKILLRRPLFNSNSKGLPVEIHRKKGKPVLLPKGKVMKRSKFPEGFFRKVGVKEIKTKTGITANPFQFSFRNSNIYTGSDSIQYSVKNTRKGRGYVFRINPRSLRDW